MLKFSQLNCKKSSKVGFMGCTGFVGLFGCLNSVETLRGGGSRTSDVIFAFKQRVISATKPETHCGTICAAVKRSALANLTLWHLFYWRQSLGWLACWIYHSPLCVRTKFEHFLFYSYFSNINCNVRFFVMLLLFLFGTIQFLVHFWGFLSMFTFPVRPKIWRSKWVEESSYQLLSRKSPRSHKYGNGPRKMCIKGGPKPPNTTRVKYDR